MAMTLDEIAESLQNSIVQSIRRIITMEGQINTTHSFTLTMSQKDAEWLKKYLERKIDNLETGTDTTKREHFFNSIPKFPETMNQD